MPLFYLIFALPFNFNLPFRAWEQRKLGDITESFSGGTPQAGNSDYYDGEIPFIRSGEINDEQTELFITDEGLNNSSAKIVEKGDILYALYGATSGEVGISQINGAINQAILAIRPTKDDNSYLIVQWLLKQKEAIIRTYLQGGQGNLSSSIVKELTLMLPKDKTEQAKIGVFFKQLDDTIALHQRKLDALKLLKKGFLQQMVTKSGENIPKIRFDDFDDIWEQRILGEFLKESKIKGSNGSLAKKLTVKLWRKGVVPKEEIYTGSSATQYYIRKTGQFMYGKLDFLNQAFGIVPLELNGYESTLDSPAFDIEDSLNETFLLEYVSLARFYKYQGNIANGSRRAKRIHTDTFFEMPIPLPNSNEQQKIGTFSQQIDDLITLQQNKLEKLSSLKRFYLKNMFI
ncbi:restriction endonuclease subunit S [Listeria monocytogenes]|uniref:restriction endonuclease subunit S n=1 Tax=Listeria monocytogenes TaxID=1639 RepID=UPI00190F66A1|nr:restriction endonuclease subunit S [Listeria monocytogenes]EJH6975132.1 restriction endonuclease subunit S [Listeria monocytogenes]EJT4835452.1 restriction endonuclease subunit S [Listeria monocytogenes]EKZ0860529.1 restriction endonuclease subunit S [Listeria monocytogenes]EKZ0912999.1 restriction endonuclease subunit S [Listeria monocytogenes]